MGPPLSPYVQFRQRDQGRAWGLSLEESAVVQRTDEGDVVREEHPSAKDAVLAARRLLLAGLDDGFELDGALPRFDAVDDPREQVAADEALEAGDRRGDLTLALANVVRAEVTQWSAAWDTLKEALRRQNVKDGASKGLATELRAQCETTAEREALMARLTTPEGQRLSRLEVEAGGLELQPLIDSLAARPTASLRELVLDSSARHLGDLGSLLAPRPRLRSLRLKATGFDLGAASLPLTKLVVTTHRFLFTRAIKSLKAPIFPDLRTLALEVTVPDDVFDWLFSGAHFPALTTLRLQLNFDDAPTRLLPWLTKKAKLFKRLRRLDLLGRFDYQLLGELRHAAPVLAPLHRLGVGISREGVQYERLRQLVPGLEAISIGRM